MNEPFWIMQGYEIYIWPSYVLTLLSLVLLFVHSTKQSQKAKKLLKQLSEKKLNFKIQIDVKQMNPKYRRLFITIIILLTLGLATKLILIALEDNIVYFYTPNDLIEKFGDTQNIQNKIRIGGLVLESSIKKEGKKSIFIITDRKKEVKVVFDGSLPDLFREGQGIVAEGIFKNNNFIASEVLAKHDENYMPPEVADALKKNNVWKGDAD